MFHKIRQTALQQPHVPSEYFDLAIYSGFLIFVLALPFGYATGILNAGILLSLLGWIGRVFYAHKFEWKRTPLDIPIALFLLLALVASFFAPHQSLISSLRHFWKLLRAVLLFYAMVNSRLGTRWRNLVIAFMFAGGFASVLGLWYYINGAQFEVYLFSVELRFQNHPGDDNKLLSVDLKRVFENHGFRLSQNATISVTSKGRKWLITDKDRKRKYAVRKSENHLNVSIIEPHLAGTFKAPNDLGAYLAIVLPMTMGYLIAGWHTRRKDNYRAGSLHWGFIAIFGVILCVMIANLALTLTRGAWIGVFVATIYIVFYFERRLLWGLLIFVLLFPFLMPQAVKERFETMRERPSGFMSERPQWWGTALQLIAKYPIMGVGLDRFGYEYRLHGPPDMHRKPTHVHNIYLQIAVEQGIPSLLLFIWMLFLIFRQFFALRKMRDFWRFGLFIGCSGFLISVLVYGLADHTLYRRPLLMFWFLNGLVFYVTAFDGKGEDYVIDSSAN